MFKRLQLVRSTRTEGTSAHPRLRSTDTSVSIMNNTEEVIAKVTRMRPQPVQFFSVRARMYEIQRFLFRYAEVFTANVR
jgi:hypothetical protein